MTDPYYHGPERRGVQPQPQVPKPVESRAPLVARLERLLERFLADCDGAVAALVVTDDGFPVARRFRNELEPRRLAAITSSLLGLSESMARESTQGQCRNVIVENEQGHVVMMRIDRLHILTAIAGPATRLGMLISTARKCALAAADPS